MIIKPTPKPKEWSLVPDMNGTCSLYRSEGGQFKLVQHKLTAEEAEDIMDNKGHPTIEVEE